MNWYRILALVRRNITLVYRGIDPLIDIFYWPLHDIILWGFTSAWVALCEKQPVSLMWLTGLVLWQACARVNLDVSLNLLTELWSRNVVNLFASPLEIKEWIVAAMMQGAVDAVVTMLFGGLVAGLLYKVNIFSLGWLFLPSLLLLILSGWAIGFLAAGCIILGGQKVQKLVWVLGWFFLPFSALMYPLSSLPAWALWIAKATPMSYVFEGLRVFVVQGIFPWHYLGISLLLNCFYLTLALLFFIGMFQKSKAAGLARLDSE